MKEIRNQSDFVKWINTTAIDKDFYNRTRYHIADDILKIINCNFIDIDLRHKYIESTEFENCSFENCNFDESFICCSILQNCRFINCKISWSKFIDIDLIKCIFDECIITGLELSDVKASKVIIQNSREILDLQIRPGQGRDFSFINSYIAFLDIEPNKSKIKDKFHFTNCLIRESNFDRIDFYNSIFNGCSLSLNQFTGCLISERTFNSNNETPSAEYNFIDIRTITNSKIKKHDILVKLSGIDFKDIIDSLTKYTNDVEYQSIFISYSFEDKEFANNINQELQKKGIKTFLWEKDSPGGKQLKQIMKSGVKEHDRILFIASVNSLKSNACHFELTEGRKKQEKIWEDVLFPIHIDDYLFEIEKEDIRPKKVQDEYWNNIEELKSLNSLDFSEFKKSKITYTKEFNSLIIRLIQGLTKKDRSRK